MNHYNCIYMYTNKINGKRYIGQAKNFEKRHRKHISSSYSKNSKYDYNVPFHRAIRKYGIENFDVVILKENLSTQCLINIWEMHYIDKYNTLVRNNNGYNIASGGHNGNNFAGKTEEEMIVIRKKMSESQKGKKLSEETKQKLRKKRPNNSGENSYWYGRNPRDYMTEEAKKQRDKKASESLKGKKLSEETKQKMKENHADFNGKNNPNLGKLIERYSCDGILIDINYQFEFVNMGFEQSSISKCCNGKQKYTKLNNKKFIFRYAEEVKNDE